MPLAQVPLVAAAMAYTSHKVFLMSFCISQLPHKSVNLSFTITKISNKLVVAQLPLVAAAMGMNDFISHQVFKSRFA